MQAALYKLAGQEGLEPPTCGFGDRRSTNWSYWPMLDCLILSSLAVNGVMAAPLTILLHLHTIRIVLLVLFGRVVAALAVGARQGDQGTHEFSSMFLSCCRACRRTHEFQERSPHEAGSVRQR